MITVTEATASAGALKRLSEAGVSIWLDDLSRRRIESGNLAELVRTKGVVGVTTNPSIGPRWQALQEAGANRQRPLWASTGVKDPSYADTLYVDGLVAPGTVNTMPEATLDAVADHGDVRGDTVTGGYDRARADLAAVERLGIAYDEVVRQLEDEGVAKFEVAWQDLLDAVTKSLNSMGVDAE
ncbi:transaldolase family protein [Streptomyces sp. NPDC094143]|uniref:transaldolase family protein n=1 Tax=Streptomyces sp. NPDC094143 TaxID=3155310 RepID=UPI00332F9E7B